MIASSPRDTASQSPSVPAVGCGVNDRKISGSTAQASTRLPATETVPTCTGVVASTWETEASRVAAASASVHGGSSISASGQVQAQGSVRGLRRGQARRLPTRAARAGSVTYRRRRPRLGGGGRNRSAADDIDAGLDQEHGCQRHQEHQRGEQAQRSPGPPAPGNGLGRRGFPRLLRRSVAEACRASRWGSLVAMTVS